MHSNHDNMHKNVIFYALICINCHIITCTNFFLSILKSMKLTIYGTFTLNFKVGNNLCSLKFLFSGLGKMKIHLLKNVSSFDLR